MTVENDNIKRWDKCLQIFKDNLDAEVYESWFAPITEDSFVNDDLVLRLPTEFFCEQLEQRFYNLFKAVIRKEYGPGVKVHYKYDVVRSDEKGVMTTPESHPSPAVPVNGEFNPYAQQESYSKSDLDPQLNPFYTFENYCESNSNKLAYTIANAIVSHPDNQTFNPMFIFGPTGVGKTHLIQAIGLKMKERNPQARVLYLSARTFENQFTSSVKNKKINDFLNFYQSIDMLIVDDVQDLAGKTATQNTFFHIFNHLHNKQHHLILSSDCPPAELDGMEPRLLSRFKWGMTVELSKPDYDLRRMVLLQKAQQAGVKLPDDIVNYVAENVKDNVREIEGVFTSLMAHSMALNAPLTVDLARNVLSNSVKIGKRQITFDTIVETVCAKFNVERDTLSGKSKKREIADARQLVMLLAKKFAKMSSTTIGLKLNRNHATVLYACKTVEERLTVDKDYRAVVEQIEAGLC